MEVSQTAMRALLVEDDYDDYILIRDMLSDIPDMSYELQWVKDFDAAVEAVSKVLLDVCLLDYRLGERSGLELLEKVKQEGCRIPVIILTGQGDRAVGLLAMQSGADDYLEKDRIDSSILDRSMRYAINRKQKEIELKKTNEGLEQRVQERTAQLAVADEALQAEVSLHRQAEEALERNGRHFLNVLDNSIAMMSLLDRDGIVVEISRTALDIAGLSSKDVLGKRFEECYWFAWSPDVQKRLKEAITGAALGEISRYHEIIRVGEGQYRTIDFMLAPICDHEGRVSFLVPSASDITERKRAEDTMKALEWLFVPEKTAPVAEAFYGDLTEIDKERLILDSVGKAVAEEALRESEERYRNVFENALLGILRTNIEGTSLQCNHALAKMLGYDSSEELHSSVSDIAGQLYRRPEDRGRLIAALLKNRTVLDFETEFRRKDGSAIWIAGSVRSIENKKGSITHLEGFINDISDRKKAEAALRESEEKFRTSIENMIDCFGIYSAICDEKGKITDFLVEYVNDAACASNRMTRDEQIGKRLLDLFPAHTITGLFEEYCKVVETGRPLLREEVLYEDYYGSRRMVRIFDIRAAKMGNGFIASWRDITERKQMEEELRQARDELEVHVQERTEELCKAIDALTSEIRERMNAEEAFRKSEIRYSSIVNAFDGYIYLCSPDYRIQFMNQSFLSWLGYDATGELCYKSLRNRDSICPWCVNEKVFRGETVRFEMHNTERDRYYYMVASPIKGSDGAIWKQGISIDITEQKLAEMNLRARESELAEKSLELEETNTALRILLRRREEDRNELEENIMYNAQQMILPYIEKLKNTRVDNRQKIFLDLLESNTKEIISPFARKLFWKFSNLTAMELQVASLVQEGKTGKEIADLLNITEGTVKFHKINLRKKCGLKERKSNLKAFLQSFLKA